MPKLLSDHDLRLIKLIGEKWQSGEYSFVDYHLALYRVFEPELDVY